MSVTDPAPGSDAPTLKLGYVFSTSPNPIRASLKDATATATVHVIVSNPTPEPVTVNQILIQIRVGGSMPAFLSEDKALPAPTPATSGGWTISGGTNDTIAIRPANGTPLPVLGDAISFSVEDIEVNETVGLVTITITETTADGKAIDGSTYFLAKLPANYPIATFTATPAILTDIDQTTSLTWSVTAQGQNAQYRLRANPPGSQAQAGPFPAASGQAPGVKWSIDDTTTFMLRAIVTDGSDDTVLNTARTTVRMVAPYFAKGTHATVSPSGRFVSLHWKVYNATACIVTVDGNTIDSTAPIDTYDVGYLVPFPDASPGLTHQLTVTPVPMMGHAKISQDFSTTVRNYVTLKTGTLPYVSTFTSDSTWALLVDQNDATVSFIDPVSRKVANAVQTGPSPCGIAIGPHDQLAFVANTGTTQTGGSVTMIDVQSQKFDGTIPIPAGGDIGTSLSGVAATPDGRLLVTDELSNSVVVVDVASATVGARIPTTGMPLDVAIAGSHAFSVSAGSVTVIDLTTQLVATTLVNQSAAWSTIAATPDGSRVVVVGQLSQALGPMIAIWVIDTSTQQSTTFEVLGINPSDVCITPDSSRAIVANYGMPMVTVVDLATRTGYPVTIGVQYPPDSVLGGYGYGVSMAPDGSALLVSRAGTGDVVFL